jgi:hypothetical protein
VVAVWDCLIVVCDWGMGMETRAMSDPDANWREHCDWLADGWDECRDEVARLGEENERLRGLLASTRNMWAIVAHDAAIAERIARGHECDVKRQIQSDKDRALGEVARIDAALADQPGVTKCNCDDHDARYCVNRPSRGKPCQCACHGASDTAAHSGGATTTVTQPTLQTSTDKSEGSNNDHR